MNIDRYDMFIHPCMRAHNIYIYIYAHKFKHSYTCMHAPDFLAMAYLPLPHCVPRKLQRRFRLLGCKWGVPGFCKLDGFKKVSLLNFNVGLFITFSNVAVSKSLFEATDEELKSSMPPPVPGEKWPLLLRLSPPPRPR